MSIEQLRHVLPPPIPPIDNSGDWAEVERVLGFAFPRDYKQYIATYGSIEIGGWIRIYNPFARSPWANLLQCYPVDINQYISWVNRSGDRDSDDGSYPLYPEPDGLFPWCFTRTGATLFWLQRGEPDTWPIVIDDWRFDEDRFQVYEETMTSLLAKIIAHDLEPIAVPENFPLDTPNTPRVVPVLYSDTDDKPEPRFMEGVGARFMPIGASKLSVRDKAWPRLGRRGETVKIADLDGVFFGDPERVEVDGRVMERPSGVIARLDATALTVPRGERLYTPAGYDEQVHQVGYLLGNLLGGPVNDPRNYYLAPLVGSESSKYIAPQLTVEQDIARALETGAERYIYYRVVPDYIGMDVVAKGLTIQAIGSNHFYEHTHVDLATRGRYDLP